MRGNDTFAERLKTAATAKQAQLERARAKDPTKDPAFAERQAARSAAAAAREARIAEKKAEREAATAREAEERAAAEAARELAAKLEAERLEVERIAEGDRLVALAAAQKAERDARYAARKARKR
jgi:hypothetical protein